MYDQERLLAFPDLKETIVLQNPFSNNEVELINIETNDHNVMASKFKILSNVFSIIPLHLDFTDPQNCKKPIEKEWNLNCWRRVDFKPENYIGRNAGIACGVASGVIVIDIDDHKEFASWCKQEKVAIDSIETFTVKSGGKSLHLYFKYPDRHDVVYGNKSVKAVDKHTIFDIKGMGGQVVAPGSIHPNGKIYTIAKNLPFAEAPECFLKLVRKWPSQDNLQNLSVETIDTRVVSDRVMIDIEQLRLPQYIVENISTNHPVGERSEHEMSAICSLVKLGIDDETITSIFENPKYPIGAKYRESGKGRFKRMQQHLITAKNLVSQTQSTEQEYGVISFGDIISKAPTLNFVVDGLWAENDTMMIFGNGGTGKSLLALQLAIALAEPPRDGFLGKFAIPKNRNILILQSEISMAGVYDRSQKMFAECNCSQSIKNNISFVASKNNIMPSGDFNDNEFISKISEVVNSGAHDVLIIDPLISFHNEDENANTQMRRVLDRVKSLGVQTNTSILIVHHSGKGTQGTNYSGGRGASSIGDWASSSVELKRKGNSASTNFELIHRKARDFQEFGVLNLERTPNLIFKLLSTEDVSIDSKDLAVIRAINAFNGVSTNQITLARKIMDQYSETSGNTISKNTAIKWIKNATKHNIITLDPNSKSFSIAEK